MFLSAGKESKFYCGIILIINIASYIIQRACTKVADRLQVLNSQQLIPLRLKNLILANGIV